MSKSGHFFYQAKTLLFIPLKIGAYLLAALTIIVNIGAISVWSYFLNDWRTILFHIYTHPKEHPHPVLFSFYQFDKSDDQIANDIQRWAVFQETTYF